MRVANTNKISEEKDTAKWWERVVVGVLLIIAIVYSRSALSAPAPSSSTKTLQSLARIYMSQGQYDKAETLVDSASTPLPPMKIKAALRPRSGRAA